MHLKVNFKIPYDPILTLNLGSEMMQILPIENSGNFLAFDDGEIYYISIITAHKNRTKRQDNIFEIVKTDFEELGKCPSLIGKATLNREENILIVPGMDYKTSNLYKFDEKAKKLTEIFEKKQPNHKRDYENFQKNQANFYHYDQTGFEFIKFINCSDKLNNGQILDICSFYPNEAKKNTKNVLKKELVAISYIENDQDTEQTENSLANLTKIKVFTLLGLVCDARLQKVKTSSKSKKRKKGK
jgi:hypothetical protein